MVRYSSTAVLREKLQFAESGSHLSLFSFRSGPDVPLVIDRVSGQVLHSVVSVRPSFEQTLDLDLYVYGSRQ